MFPASTEQRAEGYQRCADAIADAMCKADTEIAERLRPILVSVLGKRDTLLRGEVVRATGGV